MTGHVAALREALDRFTPCEQTALRWGRALARILPTGGRLLAAGNGGSAAQAQHLTAELVGRYRDDRRPFSAVCLSADAPVWTATARGPRGDDGFAYQVRAHGRPGDVLVLLSTSGGSPNILAAARQGRAAGLTVWALTGRTPNPLADAADETLAVDAPLTATVQELHLVALHLMCEALDAALDCRDRTAVRR